LEEKQLLNQAENRHSDEGVEEEKKGPSFLGTERKRGEKGSVKEKDLLLKEIIKGKRKGIRPLPSRLDPGGSALLEGPA